MSFNKMNIANPSLVEKNKLLTDISKLKRFLQGWETENLHLIEELSDAEIEQELIRGSHLKRLYERWEAEPDFQQQFLQEPYQSVAQYNLNISSDKISSLIAQLLEKIKLEELDFLSLEPCQKFYIKTKHDTFEEIAQSHKEPRFQAWRARQIARLSSQLTKSAHDEIAHLTAAFELSKGCSVGCWFCSISAPRLADIFTYSQENAQRWREVLKLLKELHGDAAKASFCYWASDPLDNPDYEKFCQDFHQILGAFPQTTTALALKDPDRTRALLKLSQESGCLINRFSIISLKMLDQVYKEFSPEELAFVRLALQNPEANHIKVNSGRTREYNQKKALKNQEPLDDSIPGTNSCVSGFLFNMVESSVKLITPCNADERWPLGYRIYEEGTFASIDDLRILLEGMIDRHMPLTVRHNDKISFRSDLNYENLPDGFQVSTRFKTYKFRNAPYLKQLGEVIHKGNSTAEEIYSLFNLCGIPSTHIFDSLNLMLKNGLLDDEN